MLKKCLAICLLLILPAVAKPHESSGSSGSQRGPGMRKILQQLNLSAAQKVQVQKIMDTGVHGRERREAISKVLTPEQGAKFATLTAQMRQPKDSTAPKP